MATGLYNVWLGRSLILLLALLSLSGVSPKPPAVQSPVVVAPRTFNSNDHGPHPSPALPAPSDEFARMLRAQAATDAAWRAASEHVMRMDKITYPSRVDGLAVPAFVFQPLDEVARHTRPALVWVHENIRGHLYEHFIPYIREAVKRGYIVIAPEYRGSIGYGQAFYDAIDYGGAEVDDVVTSTSVLVDRYPSVDPERIAIIGWSHGGLIALLAATRHPTTFAAVAAIVPVTNLFQRLARKGVEQQLAAIDPQNRFGGSPLDHPEAYRERSPLFHVDALRTPLLVHVATNDDDVEIDEAMQLVDALRARKPTLADIKIYAAPKGGHTFDRQVRDSGWTPANTPEQLDAWRRVWAFFGKHLYSSRSVRIGSTHAAPGK